MTDLLERYTVVKQDPVPNAGDYFCDGHSCFQNQIKTKAHHLC